MLSLMEQRTLTHALRHNQIFAAKVEPSNVEKFKPMLKNCRAAVKTIIFNIIRFGSLRENKQFFYNVKLIQHSFQQYVNSAVEIRFIF